MIVEFSVKNFRSINSLQTLSFAATPLHSNREKYPEVDENNVAEDGGLRLLKTIGIFGANASGKSNVINALVVFLNAIKAMPSPESRIREAADPFLFQETNDSASFFQIVLVLEGKKYRYGFTAKENPRRSEEGQSSEIITAEWLFGPKNKNQAKLFTRERLLVDTSGLPNSSIYPAIQHEHGLFLSHAAAFDREGILFQIRDYLASFTISNDRRHLEKLRLHTLSMLQHPSPKQQLLRFLEEFGLIYEDIEVDLEGKETIVEAFQKNKVFLIKAGNDNFGNKVRLNLATHESDGTRKLFDMAGLLFLAGKMRLGGLFIFDELDSNFHPALVKRLLELCNSNQFNAVNFQMLFTSHDTNLMDPALMRRDQFYFTEKIQDNSTKLYSLADLKGIRNDAEFARQYLAGFYGAVPLLHDLSAGNPITHA
jgi:uncharacterized protein